MQWCVFRPFPPLPLRMCRCFFDCGGMVVSLPLPESSSATNLEAVCLTAGTEAMASKRSPMSSPACSAADNFLANCFSCSPRCFETSSFFAMACAYVIVGAKPSGPLRNNGFRLAARFFMSWLVIDAL